MNKVNSKAVLRWDLEGSPSVPPEVRDRLRTKLATRLTTEGCLVLTSDRHRDQKQNKDDCAAKLAALIKEALAVEKIRRDTRPTRSSKRKNREGKSRIAEKKKLRGKIEF